MLAKILGVGLCLLFFCSLIIAQAPTTVQKDPFTFEIIDDEAAKLVASPDAITTSVFPRFPNGKFPSGERVEVLVGFRNKGSKSFNITAIDASFNYPLDYNYYIQNFTEEEYGIVVPSGEEVTASYSFQPDPLLEMRDFGLVVSVFYNDIESNGQPSTNWTTTLFNSTVDIVEAEGGVDAQAFFAYLAVVAVAGLGVYVLYRNLSAWTKRQKKKSTTPSERTDAAQDIDDDWLAGTSADPNLRKRKGGKKAAASPKPKAEGKKAEGKGKEEKEVRKSS